MAFKVNAGHAADVVASAQVRVGPVRTPFVLRVEVGLRFILKSCPSVKFVLPAPPPIITLVAGIPATVLVCPRLNE
jgi:hypothetical protein